MSDAPDPSRAEELFARIVEASGMSMIIGPGIIRRSLADVDLTPENATADDYLKVLPRIKLRMQGYLEPAELTARLDAIRAMLTS